MGENWWSEPAGEEGRITRGSGEVRANSPSSVGTSAEPGREDCTTEPEGSRSDCRSSSSRNLPASGEIWGRVVAIVL